MNLNAIRLALRGRAKAALPATRFYENMTFVAPAPSVPFAVEQFIPATSTLTTIPADGGSVQSTGLYVINWYGVAGEGPDVMDVALSALLARFGLGLIIPASDGTAVRVRGDVGPYRGAITNVDTGRPVSTVTIPWRVETQQTL